MKQAIRHFLLAKQAKWHVDLFSGLTVALALIPEAIAFSLVAHVEPLIALYAAFFMCLITAVIGGRPGMISGATGSMAVVMVSLVEQYGIHYLFATVVLTGMLQIAIGVFRLGKFIRILPKSVMVGFVNGLAIVIFLAQLQQLKIHSGNSSHWMTGHQLYLMLGLILLTVMIMHYLPKLTRRLPAALTAIAVVTLLVHLFHWHSKVVDDMMQGHAISAGLPTFAWLDLPFTFKSLGIILPYAAVLCIIGLSESLMTLSLIDDMTQSRGRANKECIAQGVANIVCGFFKSMGGCTMLGQSMINIKTGGRGRLSGIVAGLALLLFIIALWSWIKMIPLAALVGVMFYVVFETFEWATFKFIGKIPLHDALVIVVVTVVTVFTNLAIAVIAGIIIAALVFAWQSAKNIYAEKSINQQGEKIYRLHGPLFFASTTLFKSLFDVENDPQEVIIDFMHSRVSDHSAIDAIQAISERYRQQGKNLHLRHLSAECRLLLEKAQDLIEVNQKEDPDYHVATDKLARD